MDNYSPSRKLKRVDGVTAQSRAPVVGVARHQLSRGGSGHQRGLISLCHPWFKSKPRNQFKKENTMSNSMTTKTGKPKLGPLNLVQLKDMLEKTSRAKDKSKILNRIRTLESRNK